MSLNVIIKKINFKTLLNNPYTYIIIILIIKILHLIFNFNKYLGFLYSFHSEIFLTAENLLHGNGFSCYSPFVKSAAIGPIYPLLIFFIFKMLGFKTYLSAITIILINIFAYSLVPLILFKIGKKYFNKKIAIISIFISFISILTHKFLISDAHQSQFLPFLNILTFYFILNIFEKNNNKYLLFISIFITITINTKETLMLYFIFILFFLLFKGLLNFKNFIIILSLILIFSSPWIIRNKLVFNEFIPLRSGLYTNLYLGNVVNHSGHTLETFKHSILMNSKEKAFYFKIGEVKYDQIMKERFIFWLKNNPYSFLKLTLNRFYLYWFGEIKYTYKFLNIFEIFLFYLQNSLIFLWIIYIFKQKQFSSLNLLLLFLIIIGPISNYIFHTIYFYRLELEPFYILISANMIYLLTKKSKIFQWIK